MGFVVIPDLETFRRAVDAGQLPGLAALGVEVVLIQSMVAWLDPEAAMADVLGKPPFRIVPQGIPSGAQGPFPVTQAQAVEFMSGEARARIEAGEPCVLVVPHGGAWFWNRQTRLAAMIPADDRLVEGIERHFGTHAASGPIGS